MAACRTILKDEMEAEEAAQEAWLAAFENIHRFEGRSAFSTWMHAIAVNRAKMRLRKRKPVPSLSALSRAHVESVLSSQPPLRPDDAALLRERSAATHRALQHLDPESRAIVLERAENRPLQSMAHARDLSVAALKSRVFRVREQMKTELLAAGL